MEYQEIANEYRIVGVTLAHEGKVHCGDYLSFSEIASEQLVLLTLSDGVGSLHYWIDSKSITLSVQLFLQGLINRIQKALKKTQY